MEAVWSDMARTQLPTWIGSPPRRWGTKAYGKLSADQWRVICTIHLPITLIRLWEREEGRKKDLLVNFMELVTAVRIANMRVSSADQIKAYNEAMTRHIKGLQILFPNAKLRPSHHAALHIGDILDLFGPVHSHSAPFFERYINFLHRVNTNNKLGILLFRVRADTTPTNIVYLGEMEATFMKAAARYANLTAILADDEEIRQTVLETVTTMEAIAKEDVRGFRLASILDPSQADFTVDSKEARPIQLSGDEFELFKGCIKRVAPSTSPDPSPNVLAVDEISIRGVCYSTATSRKSRDSGIMFRSHDSEDLRPGVIKTIFQPADHPKFYLSTKHKGFHLVVHEYPRMEPSNERVDPYLEFGFAAGFLCQKNPTTMHVLELSQIVSHFALTEFSDQDYKHYIHALPVDRVSVYPIHFNTFNL